MASIRKPSQRLAVTAISFSTATTWQAYAGENTMSYFSQMIGFQGWLICHSFCPGRSAALSYVSSGVLSGWVEPQALQVIAPKSG